ncbi:MAG: M48 family metallopeptidase [Phenylobacterium sp.]|uniref:M48 family metallopeptidase n=1 Tax=Phenylobacterium sp. TaxID=1871053 RepID=UPI001A502A22|nr:M48 family metallopeptidase [Phenylobacterium sp.]MBL8774110.1 M48 family metallopeptidase [Phenylobacterium sp.]
MCGVCFSRRGLLAALGAVGLAGCSENAATGRRQLVFVDDGQLATLADRTWNEVVAKIPPVADPAAQARLARIGAPLVKAAGRDDLDWSFTVLDSPEFNAFVLPNGRVGFFRGLMEFARDDGAIASVVGHEIGHVLARHSAERMSQEIAVQAGVGIAQLLISQEAGQYADEIGAALGAGAVLGVILPYSRKHELEADRVGVDLMRKAGQDPNDAVRFWERMIRRAQNTERPPEVISTHPADTRRLEALKAAVARPA